MPSTGTVGQKAKTLLIPPISPIPRNCIKKYFHIIRMPSPQSILGVG